LIHIWRLISGIKHLSLILILSVILNERFVSANGVLEDLVLPKKRILTKTFNSSGTYSTEFFNEVYSHFENLCISLKEPQNFEYYSNLCLKGKQNLNDIFVPHLFTESLHSLWEALTPTRFDELQLSDSRLLNHVF